MGRFTVYDDPSIDFQIKHQLDEIVKVIVDMSGKNVKSIILSGGFGRGEGSVKLVEGRGVHPLKDYDLLVIVRKKPNSETINRIYGKVYSVLGLSNPEGHLFRFSDFVVDLQFITQKRLRLLTLVPDIMTYELSRASYLLFGEDVREDISWEATDIPLASGWRFLFEKMTGLIGHFSQKYLLGRHVNQQSKELLVYECYKTFVEIMTALNLLMGCYAPSFSQRKKLFINNFSERLPELYERLPKLLDLVAKATDFKLKPRFKDVKNKHLDLWFETRDTLLEVSKFYLKKFLGIYVTDFIESQNLVRNELRKKYFEPIASALASNLISAHIPYVKDLLNFALQFHINYRYVSDMHHNYRHLPFRILMPSITAVTIQLHVVAPQVLLSIRKDGSIDETYFEIAKDNLCCLSPHCRLKSFEDLRIAYLTSYGHLLMH